MCCFWSVDIGFTMGWDAVPSSKLQIRSLEWIQQTIRTCLCVLLDAEGGRPGLKPVVWGVQMESDVPVMCTDSTHDMINNENFTM